MLNNFYIDKHARTAAEGRPNARARDEKGKHLSGLTLFVVVVVGGGSPTALHRAEIRASHHTPAQRSPDLGPIARCSSLGARDQLSHTINSARPRESEKKCRASPRALDDRGPALCYVPADMTWSPRSLARTVEDRLCKSCAVEETPIGGSSSIRRGDIFFFLVFHY